MREHAQRVWRVAGIGFDHRHMGDLLRLVHKYPGATITGLCDPLPDRMAGAARTLDIPPDRLFTDYLALMETAKPDIVILCHAAPSHREWVERLAPLGVHILVEKPFAASLADADAMISAMSGAGRRLAIHWPLAWYPSHVTCKRIIESGMIGEPIEIHYYGGNRGPLHQMGDREGTGKTFSTEEKRASSWYREGQGGGSLRDYLGYGATLATWFLGGQAPIEVTAMTDSPDGLEVDEHSITLARYPRGLSRFETRWGTFTDPWIHPTQPGCGFVVLGTEGTVSSQDFGKTLRIQDRARPEGYDLPVDLIQAPLRNPIQYLINCLETEQPIRGPTSPGLSRIGQAIMDAAILSARLGRTASLREMDPTP